MAELIVKDHCPQCQAVNFVNDGDPHDASGIDLDGIKCHKCGYIWLFEDDPDFLTLERGGEIDNCLIADGKATVS